MKGKFRYQKENVIGTVVGIGEIVAVNSIGSSKIRRTIVIEDEEYESRKEYDANQNKIQLVAQATKVVTPQEFMNGAVKKKANVLSMQQFTSFSTKVGGRTSAVKCVERKLNLLQPKGQLLLGLNRHGGVASIISKSKLLLATSTYFPEELDGIIGKKFLFRIKFSKYNHNNNNHVYRCEKVQNDEEIIKYWNRGFIKDQDSEKDTEADSKEDVTDDSYNYKLQQVPALVHQVVIVQDLRKKVDAQLSAVLLLLIFRIQNLTQKMMSKSPMQKKALVAVDKHPIGKKAIVTIKVEKDVSNDVDKSAANDVENDAKKDEEPK
nr:replication protein A 70 kDa DNA-binding subunit B [Tanacetum cinerariifolium]